MPKYAILTEDGFWCKKHGRGPKRRGENFSWNPFEAFAFDGVDSATTGRTAHDGVRVKLTYRKIEPE